MGSNEKYDINQLFVGSILTYIQDNEIVVPEIQRPFVWNASQVRDLIDSLYNRYPTGYLIIWRNPNVRLKDGKNSEGKRILIDGQQRVTALMTAVAGFDILTEDYKQKTIKIAFNPTAPEDEERFAVQTPAHTKDKRWIADISMLFRQDFSARSFINNYLSANPELDERLIEQSIEKLLALKTCQLGVITLDSKLDISEVTEIFVRINSQGKRLDQADFAMSKIAADEKYGGNLLRKAIDYFCRLAVDPSFYHNTVKNDSEFMNSEYEPRMRWIKDNNDNIYGPNYNDMLRVSFMHQIQRGKLADLVSMLSGRDFAERSFKEEIAEKSFEDLKKGVLNFISQHHFESFISIIKSAGFISPKLLHSKMTLDFAYALYLLLHSDSSIPKQAIKSKVQKWFILSTISGRYSSSPESQMDRDLRSINGKGFEVFFKESEASILSESFWSTRLVQDLETSSLTSPYFNAYIAAQVFFGTRSLLSASSKILDLISAGDVHHIFPKAYLRAEGIDKTSDYNQIANYTYLDTQINHAIGKKPPCEYFPAAQKGEGIGDLKPENFESNLRENDIPPNTLSMDAKDYFRFLAERRKLMAASIKRWYESL